MALKPCRDCKADISTRAKVCPHCGLKRPHDLAIQHTLNAVAKACFGLGLLLCLLVPLGMCAFGALAGGHRHVAGDALERKECYILLAPMTIMSSYARAHALRNVRVPEGNIICIDKVDNRGAGNLWYQGRIMRMGTLDRSLHMPVWVDSRDLMEYGLTLAY